MEIISTEKSGLSEQAVKKVVTSLQNGAIIIYPTETAYAIGGDALNKKVIKKIYAIKQRSAKLPLPVIVSDLEQAKKYAYFDSKSLSLAKKFWPGALTLILKKKKTVPSMLAAGRSNIAMRVSGSSISRRIAKELGRPIISTSANSSKQIECYSISAIKKQIHEIDNYVELILDAGRLPEVRPSTIIKMRGSKVIVLREGGINIHN
jgi:L-threonylcarbamoyladenylate synthase